MFPLRRLFCSRPTFLQTLQKSFETFLQRILIVVGYFHKWFSGAFLDDFEGFLIVFGLFWTIVLQKNEGETLSAMLF